MLVFGLPPFLPLILDDAVFLSLRANPPRRPIAWAAAATSSSLGISLTAKKALNPDLRAAALAKS